MTTTTKLGLELLQNSAANQVLANMVFAKINQLIQAGAVSQGLSAPPGSPADEALYIVAASPTGLWSGQAGKLAFWLASVGTWSFIEPREGFLVHINDEDQFYKYDGTSWVLAFSGGGGGGMTNPMTTLGDIIRGAGSGTPQRLAIGTTGQILTVVGGTAAWADAPSGGGGMTNPMTTSQDIIVGGSSGAPDRLGKGTNGQVLTVNSSGILEWATPASPGMSNPMTTALDLIIGGSSGTPTRLGVGLNGQVLTISGSSLVWATPSGGGGGMTNPMTTDQDIIVGGASGTPGRLGKGANGQVLTVNGSGILAWATPASPGMANPMTTSGDLIAGGASGAPGRLAAGTNGRVLTMVSGAPAWADLPAVTPAPAPLPIIAESTTSRTLALTDATSYIRTSNGSATTITVPPQSSVAWAANTEITIEQGGAGLVTIAAGAGVTINKLSTNTLSLAGQYGVVTLKRTASDVWTLFGALGV